MKDKLHVIRDVPQHWVGDGFPVRSLFSYNDGNQFDPFLLMDYAGPFEFAPTSEKRGVGEHPHRGFETVTIVFQGELEHRDSSGSHGVIGPGDVQWMTAASGVVHEEFHSENFSRSGGVLEMIQLWVNLPAAKKMSAPRYQELRNTEIPVVKLPGNQGTVRVIAGVFAETSGAATTETPMNVWDLNWSGEVQIPFPENHTSLVFVQRGSVVIDETILQPGDLILFERTSRVEEVVLHAQSGARAIILTGQPIGEQIVGQGPFVMNTREEIQQAISDFRAGKMGRLSVE